MQLPTLQLAKLEHLALLEALRRTDTLEAAGQLLGVSRHGVQRRLRKYQVQRDQPQPPQDPIDSVL